MKKIIIVLQVVILFLVVAKAASMFGLIGKADFMSKATFSSNQALAQQAAAAPPASNTTKPVKQEKNGSYPKELDGDNLSQQRDLAAALTAKKNELENRENALRAEEHRLIALRKEIMEKISLLKSNEEKLTAVLESAQNSEIKRFKEMAKVYESTPAAKAGIMMEKLDTKTAAGITMNMKKDKAGAIWGYISPQKAVEITNEITRIGNKQQME